MTHNKPPAWFWIVAAVAVLWNLAGIAAYYGDVTMNEDTIAALGEAERNLREATPAWVTGAYAIAVFTGFAAAVALLIRRRMAVALFGISLLAVILQMGYIFIGMNAAEVLGTHAMAFPAIIILLGALQLWFALLSKRRGWVN